jgi:membrane associated rhomboid family serine protease
MGTTFCVRCGVSNDSAENSSWHCPSCGRLNEPAPGASAPGVDASSTTLTPVELFERSLRAGNRFIPATVGLVLLNIGIFAAIAISQQRVLDFSPQALLSWGADYGPRTFGAEWWRTLTCNFLHGDLGHLVGNLLFLVLLGPLLERLLGPIRFTIAYLFAGIGAALWATAWMPHAVVLGASGAVFGIYGCFLGAFLRNPLRFGDAGKLTLSVPWQIVVTKVGVLVVFVIASVWVDYLEREAPLIPHAFGLIYGFIGGLIFGPVMRVYSHVENAVRISIGLLICLLLVAVTFWLAELHAAPTVALLTRYQKALDDERNLSWRFHDSLTQWQRGKLSNAELRLLLEKQYIPELERLRKHHNLLLTGDQAEAENQRLSALALFEQELPKPGRMRPPAPKPISKEQEFSEAFRICLKLRLDCWRSMAEELEAKDASLTPLLGELLLIEMMRGGLEETANEANPLHGLIDFSKRKDKGKER